MTPNICSLLVHRAEKGLPDYLKNPCLDMAPKPRNRNLKRPQLLTCGIILRREELACTEVIEVHRTARTNTILFMSRFFFPISNLAPSLSDANAMS
jgi:hypothetical protein